MSASLRFMEAFNRGDVDLPEHDGTLRFLKLLLKPIFSAPGTRVREGKVG